MSAGMHLMVRCLYVLFAICFANGVYAQTPLRLTMSQADSLFLDKNLSLLAARLNVDAHAALEIQSRAYPNPEFSAELNARDPDNNKWFHLGNTGQKAFAIEQVILLGGKRSNEIAMARQNTYLAGLELEDLLRNLRYSLHGSFYAIYFNGRTINKYELQLSLLDSIIRSYEMQARKGNVALKEVVRLKSVYLQLNNDKTELEQDILEYRKNLQILLQTDREIITEVPDNALQKAFRLPDPDSLTGVALAYRPDNKLAQGNAELAALNLKYQRSMAVPDLTIGASYDQRGGAFNNQTNVTAGIPIPLWNRNRGNIRFAKTGIKMAEVSIDLKAWEVKAEVTEAWQNMNRSIAQYEKLTGLYNDDFYAVYDGVTENFKKRNLSILEFVDFFESYSQAQAEVSRIRKQLILSAEAVNYVTGTTIYP